MGIVMRYLTLLALGIASIFAFISAIYATAYGLFVSNAYAVAYDGRLGIVIGVMLVVAVYFAFQKVFKTYVWDTSAAWLKRHKENLFTISMVGILGLLFIIL